MLLFFIASMVGVVTGSNSLITVPVMFQFGIDEKVAVATNMFGLTFMAIGGSIPFIRQGKVEYQRLGPLVILTMISSALGAALVGLISHQGIKIIVSVAMIVVAFFVLFKGGSPTTPSDRQNDTTGSPGEPAGTLVRWYGWYSGTSGTLVQGRSHSTRATGTVGRNITYTLTFLLGIYGGLYSGGYVTILTAVLIAFFGMSYAESIASTKIINVFSSAIATLVFMLQGLVDYKLGVILAITMFLGAYVGAHYAAKMNEFWLRRIFLTTVFLLAFKTLYDLAPSL